jgi:hypothetical protein
VGLGEVVELGQEVWVKVSGLWANFSTNCSVMHRICLVETWTCGYSGAERWSWARRCGSSCALDKTNTSDWLAGLLASWLCWHAVSAYST